MKKFIWTVLVLSLSAGCAPPPTIVTPQGKTAFTADQAVVRVNELMNAAIAASASGALDVNTARTIVQWSVSADQILASTPSGYAQTLSTSWSALQPEIAAIPPTSPVGVVIATITNVIGGLQ